MPVSQHQANSDLNSVYGSGTPATIYAALTTAAPSPSGNSGAGTMVEPTGNQYGGYARVAITNNNTNFPAASAGTKSNGVAIVFPSSSGGASSPVTVTHLVFVDSNTGSYNILDYLPLPPNTIVASGGAPAFQVGAVVLTEV